MRSSSDRAGVRSFLGARSAPSRPTRTTSLPSASTSACTCATSSSSAVSTSSGVVSGADAPQVDRRALPHDLEPAVRRQPEDSRRLAETGGDLRADPVVPDADRAVQARGAQDGVLDAASHLLGVLGVAADEGLVPAEDLDHGAEPAQRLHHLLRRRPVRLVVDRQHDRVRHLADREAQRHAGADAERARLVRRGRDHGPLPRVAAPADDHRLAGELRAAQDLDRDEELVQVDVQHPPEGARAHTGHLRTHCSTWAGPGAAPVAGPTGIGEREGDP
ncbi:hypothetical protein L600_001800000470 [Isoptericola variabilis J7]|uniref:Uncharacterized protein n=1 Tax=Isoptericola variabilis (strain 225) TaxID=743718 RepID=F6FPP4_ISOV2|nr:hypothetical protein Isova_2041 [Isoptericola variabilis 225]TWH32390.1 hypothetical protein L600_001800000470 [Isoptericola variabilis J7]